MDTGNVPPVTHHPHRARPDLQHYNTSVPRSPDHDPHPLPYPPSPYHVLPSSLTCAMPPGATSRASRLFSRLSLPPPPPPPKTLFRHARRRRLRLSGPALLATLMILFLITSELSVIDVISRLGLRRLLVRNRVLACRQPVRLGAAAGGWQLCLPSLWSIQGGLVYTVGIGRNIEWDKNMIALYDTEHHGWDPTPTALDFFRRHTPPAKFHFHRIGLGPHDGNLTLKLPYGNHDSYTVMAHPNEPQLGTVMEVPILTVRSMMRRMKHRHLAILKIDIEGAEFDVIDQWARANYRPPADQVLIEFHERYFWKQPGYRNMVPNAVQKMAALGFKLIVRTRLEYTFARREAIADDDGRQRR